MKNQNELSLEVGKCYELRNGLSTTPLRKSGGIGNYKFEATLVGESHEIPTVNYWLSSGRSLLNGEGRETELDIIKQIKLKL